MVFLTTMTFVGCIIVGLGIGALLGFIVGSHIGCE